VTTRTPLIEAGRREGDMIYEKAKEKYLCNRVWTKAATSEIAKADLPDK
jgi:hypothetical protein